MAALKIFPGYPTDAAFLEVADAASTLGLSSHHDFLKLFPAQFALICAAAKTVLGISAAYSEFATEIPVQDFIMVQLAGGSLGRPGIEMPIVLDFHILKIRAKFDRGINIGSESALHTLNRLTNLLLSNGNFKGMLNIVRLDSLDFQAGPDYNSQFETEHGDQIDGALLTATYAVVPPTPLAQF